MGAPAPNQVFEDFVPKSELVTEADADILHLYLPGNVLFLLAKRALINTGVNNIV